MKTNYSSKNLDHLGLLAGFIDEMKLVELVDELLPVQSQQKLLSHGVILKALLLNGLGYVNQRLYLVSAFFADKPIAHLLGSQVQACQLNDDALGRSLDALWAYGTTGLYQQLSAAVIGHLGLSTRFGHLDSSQFHVEGQYNSEDLAMDASIVHITQGYSQDHRPDLNQAGLALIISSAAHLPIFMQALSGNASDSHTFRSILQEHIGQLHSQQALEYIVADSKLYYAEHLPQLAALPIKWISRVPSTLSLHAEVLQAGRYTLRPRQAYQCWEVGSLYGGVRQRWIVVRSQSAYQREVKSLNKKWLKKSMAEYQCCQKLLRQRFACQADAQQAQQRLEKQLDYLTLMDPVIKEHKKYDQPGKPAADAKPTLEYQLSFAISCALEKHQQQQVQAGFFILATNELEEQKLSKEEVLLHYKEQSSVEQGFRFLKNPQVLASRFFVKKPERVEALLFLMTLCLLVYAGLEYKLRRALQEQQQSLPDQKGKPTQKPTMRWIFYNFVGIHFLRVHGSQTTQGIILNLNPLHEQVLALLGKSYQEYYFP